MHTEEIPVYSIEKFIKTSKNSVQYRIEVFDKNRNFKVVYPHRHDFYEILFITQGTGKHTIDFIEYEVKPDSIFFLSPGQVHSLELSEDVKGYIFLFTSEFYLLNKTDKDKLLELPFFYSLGVETPPLYLKEEIDQTSLKNLMNQACEENNKNELDSEELIRALLDVILIVCKRIYPLVIEDVTKKGKMLVKRFKKLIDEKCQENYSVSDYAKLLSVTANHLSETVKLNTGRTSSDLINDKMILDIKRRLIYTDKSVSEIAYELNFSDQSYFSRYFKKLTGVSPMEFRSQASNKKA